MSTKLSETDIDFLREQSAEGWIPAKTYSADVVRLLIAEVDRLRAAAAVNSDAEGIINHWRNRADAASAVLAYRERELLEVKGHCINYRCRLHKAHSGPCDTTTRGG